MQDGQSVILSPKDYAWLKPEQCFVASEITFEHLVADVAWCQFSSTPQLIDVLRNPSLDYGADTRVTLHRRFVQPVLDVTLLFLGMPFVLSRGSRNIFVAAGQCLLLVAAFFVVRLGCQTLGQHDPGEPGPGRVAAHAHLPAPGLRRRRPALGVT